MNLPKHCFTVYVLPCSTVYESRKNSSGVHVNLITDLKADKCAIETVITFEHKIFASNH